MTTLNKLSTGSRLSGRYMGLCFSGTVVDISSDASDYSYMHNVVRVSIAVDSDLVTNSGWVRIAAGEYITLTCERSGDDLVVSDDLDRFEDIEQG